MDWHKHFDEIEEQGFTIIPDIIDTPEEISILREQVELALQKDRQEYSGFPGKIDEVVVDLTAKGSAFIRLLENDKMHRVFSHFLGDTCILYSFTSTVLYPHNNHFVCDIHTDMPRLIPDYHLGILMTLAIDDFTEENGATYYLPGSHRSTEKPTEEDFYNNSVRVAREAGSAVFFHPRVWHAGGRNLTTQCRSGCTVYAVRSWMRQRFDFPRMFSDEMQFDLSDRIRSFLGFNVRVPTNLKEYYVPPEKRLYKPFQG